MRNMPKVIGTGKDLYNLLGMVQAGSLDAADLKEAIRGIEEMKYIFVPVHVVSEDKRYVTTNYLAEAAKGVKVLCGEIEYTIKSVEHITVEPKAATEEDIMIETRKEKRTVIGVDADLELTAEKIGVENPVNILDAIGITQEEIDSIKGGLAKYE